MSRWYFRDRPGEVYRLMALASATLTCMGVQNPQAHVLIVRNTNSGEAGEQPDGVGTLLVSRTPLSTETVDAIEQAASRLKFEVVLSPKHAADETFARLASGRDLEAFTSAYPINISPPTDDSPFFFNMLRLRDIAKIDQLRYGKSTHNMEAVFVLGVLLLTVLLLTVLCIVVPLWLTTDRATLTGSTPLLLFFAAIGLGFMLVEISQMQRLIVMLGHPTYGLTVVLFTLLLLGGLGSWSTQGVSVEGAGRALVTRLSVLIVMLVVFGLATPWLVTTRRRLFPRRAGGGGRADARASRLPDGDGLPAGDEVRVGTRGWPHALALGHQRGDIGVRVGAGRGGGARRLHLDGVLGGYRRVRGGAGRHPGRAGALVTPDPGADTVG